jgi:hypothetical protein
MDVSPIVLPLIVELPVNAGQSFLENVKSIIVGFLAFQMKSGLMRIIVI